MESIILLGIALSKATFFIPLCGAYALFTLIDLLLKKNLQQSLKNILVLLPGIMVFLIFILGAHKHNLWAIFPGALNIGTYKLSQKYLAINVLVSLLIYLFLFLGIGIFYLYPRIKQFVSKLFQKRSITSKHEIYFLSIIIASYLLALFIVEVAEFNHYQFLFPGYIILSLLTYSYLFKDHRFKKFIPILVIFILFNAFILIGYYYIIPANKTYDLNYSKNNLFANIKLNALKPVYGLFPIICSPSDGSFYSYDLINGLDKLSMTNSKKTLLFNRLYETSENKNYSSWIPAGFIRTALSKKQAVIENHKYKGIIMQPDYPKRSLNTIYFYSIITGKTKQDMETINQLFEGTDIIFYENLSYYSYLKMFSKQNYFSENKAFYRFMYGNTKEILIPEQDYQKFIIDYVLENNVGYIIFEREEEPLEKYKLILDLELFYDSSTVKIYKVNSASTIEP